MKNNSSFKDKTSALLVLIHIQSPSTRYTVFLPTILNKSEHLVICPLQIEFTPVRENIMHD